MKVNGRDSEENVKPQSCNIGYALGLSHHTLLYLAATRRDAPSHCALASERLGGEHCACGCGTLTFEVPHLAAGLQALEWTMTASTRAPAPARFL
eukprot:scaffold277453_cov40-Tisochrysis_lutea.AAC.3